MHRALAFSRPRSKACAKSSIHARSRFRPQVELLESRTVLSAGSLNSRFGVGGLVTTSFGGFENAVAVATQLDGKIVVAGTDTALDFSTDQIAIARYNPDGSLDNTFGSGGKVLAHFGQLFNVVGAVVRPNGKIIVDALELTSSNSSENLLVQFNPDGKLDTAFGTGGSVVTPGFAATSGLFTGGKPITLGPEGEIVVVGFQPSSSFTQPMEVAEFNRDGSLNQNFGSGGISTFNLMHGFPTANEPDGLFIPAAVAVAVDAQDRVLVGGSAEFLGGPGTGLVSGAALFRLNRDGTLDQTFGFNGSNTEVFGFLGAQISAIAIRPDGQIVVAGLAVDPNPPPNSFGLTDFAVEQFNPDGTQDLRFGFDGVVVTRIPNLNLDATGLAIQHSGDVVVVGFTTDSSFTSGFAMTRYTPNGNLDPTFGTNGIVTTFFPNAGASGVALTPGGNIVVAGTVADPVTGHNDFGVAEYLGHPPAPFHAPPPEPPPPIPPPVYPSSGIGPIPPSPRPGPFGKFDPAFGTGGVVTSGPNIPVFLASGVATQADGKIVAVGDNANTSGLVVIRYNPDGSLDQSFGSGGVVNTLVGAFDFYGSVAIQLDGKIVVAGQETDPVTFQDNILVVRYNPDGSLDQSFGSGGIVTTALPNAQNFFMGSSTFFASPSNAVTLTKDGKILVVGTAAIATSFGSQDNGQVIAEYDQHGNLVPGFGSGGLVITTSFTDSAGNTFTSLEVNGVAVDRRGRILVAGNDLLARYNPDGSLDQTFGFQGAVTNVFGVAGSNVFAPVGQSANAVAVRPDGKIVVAGSAIDPESLSTSFAVEQFNPDGSPDLNFASRGIALWGTADGFFNVLNATSLVLQPSGDIVVAGSESTDLFSNSLGIIRLRPNGTFDPSFGSNGVATANTNSVGLDQFTPVLLTQELNGDIVAEGTFSITPFGFIGEIGLAEFTAGPPFPHLPPGLASSRAAIQGQAGGGLDIGGAALAQPPTPAASPNQPANSTPPPGTPGHGAGDSAAAVGGSARTRAFVVALSGAPVHDSFQHDAESLDVLASGTIDMFFASIR
jgi:uncharacterized delta-60 repeat protein